MGRGHQLDPGTKRRSGGYTASSPSGPGARNPRGKALEYKHERRLARSARAKNFYGQLLRAGHITGKAKRR
jgi:hypothetical protein